MTQNTLKSYRVSSQVLCISLFHGIYRNEPGMGLQDCVSLFFLPSPAAHAEHSVHSMHTA